MHTELMIPKQASIPVLYNKMKDAINACHSIDDCREIADQASAIGAYYKQIKDNDSVKKFIEIKLRAWRRIGEILIASGIDRSQCESDADYIRQIQSYFKDSPDGPEIAALKDHDFRTALKAARIPDDFFDANVQNYSNVDAIVNGFAKVQHTEWLKTPEGQEHQKQQEEMRVGEDNATRARIIEDYRQKEKQREEDEDIAELKIAREIALGEVGVTLDRRDRKRMAQVVFLLKRELHDILRQAAFDNHVTMQSVLRSGMLMWLVAHGYDVPSEELSQSRRSSPTHTSHA